MADRAGISRSTYSRMARGHFESMSVSKLRKVGSALEVRLVIDPRWRGAAGDRILSSRHAAMTEVVARRLLDAGWQARPEVSFSHFGERGVVVVVAWNERYRALLLVELKTELVDVNDLLAVTDRRRRLARVIAESLGWTPTVVGQWLVVAETRTTHRRVAAHRTILRAALPEDGRSVPGWLAQPDREIAALWYLPDSHALGRTQRLGPTQRVRVKRSSTSNRDHAA